MNSSIICIVLLFTISTVPTHGIRVSSDITDNFKSDNSDSRHKFIKSYQQFEKEFEDDEVNDHDDAADDDDDDLDDEDFDNHFNFEEEEEEDDYNFYNDNDEDFYKYHDDGDDNHDDDSNNNKNNNEWNEDYDHKEKDQKMGLNQVDNNVKRDHRGIPLDKDVLLKLEKMRNLGKKTSSNGNQIDQVAMNRT
ncbi:Protein VHS3 [Schistosoma japonicum]|uniref:Protein VHS3 n=1 Tax=Schistosoma japonicum TaxID=6182 RepID=C1L4C7_SCHJA|nr:Protein VHS3 [Schistosoma japonicum]CAX69555.1 Protein VHS3 (Viable in a HAL3 SIT4 background protein 3) [Schistosoma japonicum]